jgi:hypothetical protein
MIIQKYDTLGGNADAHADMLSDVPTDDTEAMPIFEECTEGYDDNEVSAPFSSFTFLSSLAHGRNLS